MKFVADAQLPLRLCRYLEEAGHSSLHTLDLPLGNRTTDAELAQLADAEERILITKDDDFVTSRIARGTPKKLLLVSTGNIKNEVLLSVFGVFRRELELAFETASFIELTRELLIIHE